MEVEVAIRLLYMLAEALPVSHGAHFSGDVSKASALQDMMRTLVTSGVSSYQHTSVTLEFFETVVRYEKFFTVEPQHIPCVLMAFLDHRVCDTIAQKYGAEQLTCFLDLSNLSINK